MVTQRTDRELNSVPMSPKPQLPKLSPDYTDYNDYSKRDDFETYRSIFGSLNYVFVMIRLSISFAVSYFARFLSYPGLDPLVAEKSVLRYLRGTLDVSLVYKGRQEWIVGFSDLDWANDTEHRSSVRGYVFTSTRSPNSW